MVLVMGERGKKIKKNKFNDEKFIQIYFIILFFLVK